MLLKYFKLVNNHYGCAVKWGKGIITSPEPNQINPFSFFSPLWLLSVTHSISPPTHLHMCTHTDIAFTWDLLGLSVIKCWNNKCLHTLFAILEQKYLFRWNLKDAVLFVGTEKRVHICRYEKCPDEVFFRIGTNKILLFLFIIFDSLFRVNTNVDICHTLTHY